ncbi:MAG: large-conductance mechanosensitive channel protein MscL [Lactococcus sp.]|jgi:large conductance mechanosensitive channel|uniref:Large-conductance mechanosensitive channel n=2 Tax=Pseudolactococcus piscium TaxID=1364 RepID=A0A0D6DUK9_9LACT|nr:MULTISPECIES: large-conductance mechanosensitive channel protein MscL [Lactococcus]MBR6896215.1 large-conductance mechanosensitive channel protein MscL [Lactococcus sp.]MCJ1970802.1 large-conductance mechanosensitive channel protein MscL [Lactococcus carnosus]MCJ1980198.1 large-conductance mechanosensitive channel protein MscL [Lactococcus carnosus]MDN5402684.1 large-conductance mechanosensitive channel protein MscL [Lactococcus sp.]MDN5408956.1 large-conductance mechanosensitive channel pr
MLKEFKVFILRGNVLDLAVGVIIGGAFTAIVKSLVDNLINPLIGIFVQDGALAKLTFKLGNATFAYGKFLNDVLNFLITAFVIFILIKTINNFFMTSKKEEEVVEDVIVTEEVETLREIRDLLKQK